MKNLKKVATDEEMVAKDYTVVYYNSTSGKIGVKNAKEADYLGDFHYILTIPSDGEYPTVDSDGDYKADVISKMWIDGEEITPTTSTTLTKGEHIVDVIFTQEHMEGDTYKIGYNSYVTWASFAKRMTTVPYRSYYLCSNLTTIEIPEGVTSIGREAFYDCTSLTSVTIPNSVTNIDEDAFNGCSGLTSITIPDSVTSIGEKAFYDCSGIISFGLNFLVSYLNNVFSTNTSTRNVTVDISNCSESVNEVFRRNLKYYVKTVIYNPEYAIVSDFSDDFSDDYRTN